MSEPVDVRVAARERRGSTCVYCRAPADAPVSCACGATYHPDCRAELGRCATPGCVVVPPAGAVKAPRVGGISGADVAGVVALFAALTLGCAVVVLSPALGEEEAPVRAAFKLSFLVAPVALYLAVRALFDPRTRFAGFSMVLVLLLGAWAGWLEGPWQTLVYLTGTSAASIVVGVAVTLATARRR